MSRYKFDGRVLKHGGSTIANVRADKICQGSGSSRIASIDDVNDDIEGPGHLVKAALWLYFVH